ncbi:MAG: hypothetical protein ACM3SR_05905 [Ignavibacteriales bacterium]
MTEVEQDGIGREKVVELQRGGPISRYYRVGITEKDFPSANQGHGAYRGIRVFRPKKIRPIY